jgi:hypothetical protein
VLWASYDVGAASPEGEGAKYAWGEISWDTIPLEFDPVYMNSDMEWKEVLRPRTPSPAQVQELLDNTTATEEVLNGVSGVRYTASNGNSIFVSDVFRWTNAEKYAALNFWSRAEAACWKPSSGIIDNTNTYNEISGMKSDYTMKEYQYPFRGVCNHIPQGGIPVLEYGRPIQLTAGTPSEVYCFPKTWTSTQFLTSTFDSVQMYVSATHEFQASANDANVLGVNDFDIVDGLSTLGLSTQELQLFADKTPGDYIYVRFLSKRAATLTPTAWETSECVDNSVLVKPNVTFVVESQLNSKLYRFNYSDYSGYPITMKWSSTGDIKVYVADTCDFATSANDPRVFYNSTIKAKKSVTVNADKVNSWASYVDADGFLYLRVYAYKGGSLTFITEKPAQTDTASIL